MTTYMLILVCDTHDTFESDPEWFDSVAEAVAARDMKTRTGGTSWLIYTCTPLMG